MKISCSSWPASRVTLGLLLAALVGLPGCGKAKPSPGGSQSTGDASQGPSPLAASLASFEGELGVLIKSGKLERDAKPMGPLTLQIKNGKVRLDAPLGIDQLKGIGRAHLVIAALDKRIFAVLDDKKEVILLELDKLGDQLKSMARPSDRGQVARKTPEKAPKVTKTGHKDKVAGHDCEDWDIAAERGKVTLCVAERGVPWLKLPTLGVPAEHAWIGELLDGQHFPLRMIAYERDGQESGRIEVTKLENKTLPAQLFDIPAGYRTIELQQAIQEVMMASMGMQGMPGGIPARLKAARGHGPASKAP